MSQWFSVDKKGLAKLMEGRAKSFVLYELIQNAWDEASQLVSVSVQYVDGHRRAEIAVEDDNPEGFKDITHAYTLFAESTKKSDAEKRGRFNLGEKLVLAMSQRAWIETTKGIVIFDHAGRQTLRGKRAAGSLVKVEILMSKAEMGEILVAARRLIPPPNIKTTINGEILPCREPVASFTEHLPTLTAGEDGVLRPTRRNCIVRVYEKQPDETAMLYEMGIPVVETGDKYHVDIGQKVPLNMDRDNVTPAYLRTVRVAVLNATFNRIADEDVRQTWVKEACSDDRITPEAAKVTFEKRFGENAVAYDPSDPEANKISVAEGRPVVHGGSLSAAEWHNAKAAGVLPAAGKVTPSPKAYSETGKPLNLIPMENWTKGMLRIDLFAKTVALHLLDCHVEVRMVNEFTWPFSATYGPGSLTFNVARLGHKFFDNGITDQVIDLLIHEYGHHYESDHLSREYNDALTKLGAKMTRLALDFPEFFE
jgi:hypothetical protein